MKMSLWKAFVVFFLIFFISQFAFALIHETINWYILKNYYVSSYIVILPGDLHSYPDVFWNNTEQVALTATVPNRTQWYQLENTNYPAFIEMYKALQANETRINNYNMFFYSVTLAVLLTLYVLIFEQPKAKQTKLKRKNTK